MEVILKVTSLGMPGYITASINGIFCDSQCKFLKDEKFCAAFHANLSRSDIRNYRCHECLTCVERIKDDVLSK
jgi:hypothetical protein